MGSSPVASTKKYSTSLMCCIFLLFRRCDGTCGWEPFCGSKTLCLEKLGKTRNLLAKPDVNNVGAGRAAKGASPVASTKNTAYPIGYAIFFAFGNGSKKPRITVGSCDERETKTLKYVRRLTSEDTLPRLCKAETADTRRLNQNKSFLNRQERLVFSYRQKDTIAYFLCDVSLIFCQS